MRAEKRRAGRQIRKNRRIFRNIGIAMGVARDALNEFGRAVEALGKPMSKVG